MKHVDIASTAAAELHRARRSSRVRLNGSAHFRRPGLLEYAVKVFDASPHGCKLEFVERPRLDERIWVRFGKVEPLEALVCWVDGFVAGVEFVKPFHPAVFEQLVAGGKPEVAQVIRSEIES